MQVQILYSENGLLHLSISQPVDNDGLVKTSLRLL